MQSTRTIRRTARRMNSRATLTKYAYADYLNPTQSPQGDFVSVAREFIRRAGRWAGLLTLLTLAATALLLAPRPSDAAPDTGVAWSLPGGVAHMPLLDKLSPLAPTIFGPNVRANTDATTFGQHEPGLAMSRVSTNTVFVAAKDYRQGNIKRVWIYGSTDGGTSWPVQLHMPGLPATTSESDPVVIARDDGRIYVACLTRGNEGIFITWTDNNGQTWQPSVPVIQNQPGLQDKDWFAVDNNPASPYYHRMYMMYTPDPGPGSGVVEQHSTDGGLTWSLQRRIGGDDTEYTYPVIGSDGTVYNFMMQNWGAGRFGTVQMTKSTDGGLSWSAPTTVAPAQQPGSPIRTGDQFRFFAILSAAVDPNNGHLYVAWTDNRSYATNGTDVVYVKSTNGGATWGPVLRLSHDPTGVVRDHITPMLAVGADSRVHAFWLDRRLSPNNTLFDAWYSSSTDGGASWEADTRVSTQSQSLNVGFPPESGNAAGDYWGLDTWRDTVYVAWNDTRTGNQDILVSKGLFEPSAPTTSTVTPSPNPTLFTATPVIPTSTRTPVPPSVTPTSTSAPPTGTATNTPTTPALTSTVPQPSSTLTATLTATTTPPMGPSSTPTASPTIQQPTTTPSVATQTATASTTPSPTPDCGPAWRVVAAPNIGPLNAVEAISANDVWAVGRGILHWDGAQWTQAPIPVDNTATLYGVSAVSPDDVWAVGALYGVYPRMLILHWEGASWSRVASPYDPTSNTELRYVEAISTNDVWTTGTSFGSRTPRPLTLHWNGSFWSDRGSSAGGGLSALASNDVWAVGTRGCNSLPCFSTETLTTHWDGTQWHIMPSPNANSSYNGLRGVEALAPDDVWAVGYTGITGTSTYVGLVLHWNGMQWSIVPSPDDPSDRSPYIAVSAVSSNDIWAVGGSGAMHWDGTAWTVVHSSNASLNGVDALPSGDVWAVGAASEDPQAASVIMRYTDQRFADVPTTNTFYAPVQCLACRGIIGGYADGTFRPNNPITRGQIAKIVSNAALFSEAPGEPIYEDVPADSAFYEWVNRLSRRGVMGGYPCGQPNEPCEPGNRPYFRPQANATRGQLSKIVSNAAGFTEPIGVTIFTDVPPTHAFYEWIQRLAARGVMGGYLCGGTGEPCDSRNRPYFRPNSDVTRGQASKIVANTFFPGCDVRSAGKK